MFANKKLIANLVSNIGKVEKQTLQAMREGRIEQEPAITDRLLGVMEHVLNDKTTAGVRWTVKTLTDRGRDRLESAVLEVDCDRVDFDHAVKANISLFTCQQNN